MSDLSSPILYDLGLKAALEEWLTDEIKRKHGIETEFEDDGTAQTDGNRQCHSGRLTGGFAPDPEIVDSWGLHGLTILSRNR